VGNLKIKIKASKIMYLVIALVAIYILIYLIPNNIDKLALIPEKFYSGEYWRILTFHFSHLNMQHLLTNIGGALFVGFLAAEVKAKFDNFTIVYFLAGIIALLPFLSTMNFAALGASASIYGAFGMVALKSEKWKIRKEYVFALLIIAIFIESLIYYFNCGASCEQFLFSSKQGMLHFAGLASGSIIFLSIRQFRKSSDKRKRRALRGG